MIDPHEILSEIDTAQMTKACQATLAYRKAQLIETLLVDRKNWKGGKNPNNNLHFSAHEYS